MSRALTGSLFCAACLGAALVGCAPRDRTIRCLDDGDCPAGLGCIAGSCQPAECWTAADCAAEEHCVAHACVPASACAVDGDCPAGQVCAERACRPGCRTDAECAPGTCDPVSRTCVACVDKGDCALGELCIAGACTPGCEGDRDCPAGLRCDATAAPHGACVECTADGDCAAGLRCVAGRCLVSCAADGDCQAGEICDGGGCRPGCRGDAGCPGGRCDPVRLVCVECLEVDDCTLGELCIEGACVPGCKGDRDCPPGLTCLPEEPPHGACVECAVPGQCDAPRACVEPLALDFGTVRPGEASSRSFAIRSCGVGTLTLTGLAPRAGTSTDFTLTTSPNMPYALAAGATLSVQVQYHPAQAGEDNGWLDLSSDDVSADPATGLTASVSLTGLSAMTYCDLQVTPTALDFGVLQVGESRRLDLALRNAGDKACLLEGAEITRNSSAAEFDLPEPIASATQLAPGTALGLPVAYQPTDLGQDTGDLTIRCADVDGTELVVALGGFGQQNLTGPVAVCTVSPTQPAPFADLAWDGSQSFDSDPSRIIQVWDWAVISFPEGSAASLASLTPATRGSRVDLAGSYSAQLTVKNDLGQASQPCLATAVMVPPQEMWLELFWAQAGDDMDLHLLAPNGVKRTSTDCYYANCAPDGGLDWGQAGSTADDPVLALDDIPGLGPEIVYLPDPGDGVYTVFVHDYPGSVVSGANHVSVNVWVRGVKVATFEQDISGEDTDWDVCEVSFPSGVVSPL